MLGKVSEFLAVFISIIFKLEGAGLEFTSSDVSLYS